MIYTKEQLCRLEQPELVKLIEEGRLILAYDPSSTQDKTASFTREQAEDKLKEMTKWKQDM